MSRPAALYRKMGPAGVLALVLFLLALVVVGYGLRGLVAGLTTPATQTPTASEAESARANRYALALDGHVKQIDGRSLFFIPSEPSKPPPPPPTKPDEGPPPPPPPPSKYGGRPIMGMYAGSVWFDDGKWLKLGDTSPDGVKLLRLDAPWSAHVEWKGVEFDVPLFERDKVVTKPATPAPSATASADPKPEAKPLDPKPEAAPGDGKPAGEATPTGEAKPAPANPPATPPTPPGEPSKDAPPAPDRIGASAPESPTSAEGAEPAGQDPRS
jgi:hypothetical protein